MNLMLPVRPRPLQGEAMIGYLGRVALSNGYKSPRQLWLALKSKSNLEESLNLSTPEQQCLYGLMPSYWGSNQENDGLAVSDFNHAHLRWCPLCLMDSRHLRGVWSLKLVAVCTGHKIHLHEQCTNCGHHQRLDRPNLERCECGTRLTAGNIVAANPGLVRVTQALELSLSGQQYGLGLPSLTTLEWVRLVTYLGQFTDQYQPARPGKLPNLHRLATATHLMSGLANLLDYWPHNFHHLIRVIHQQGKSGSSLQRTFGSLYRVLYRQLTQPCYQFLRDELEAYVRQHWDGVLCKRNKSLKATTIAAHPQLTVKQAANIAGSGKAVILQLMEAELIRGHQSQSARGRISRSINRNCVGKIVTLTQNTVALKEAAKMLALPKHRVRLLIQAGIINPVLSRHKVNSSVWLIPRMQLSKLWFKTEQKLSDAKYIVMADILKYWRLSDEEFIALVKAIQIKQISAFGEQTYLTAIGKLYANEGQFRLWLTGFRIEHSNSMTVDIAAKALGIKQQVAYQLVHSGLIKSFPTSGKGVRVGADELHQFQSNYVALAELARSFGCSPRKLLDELSAKPVTGPTVDGNRQYFYRRSDIGY